MEAIYLVNNFDIYIELIKFGKVNKEGWLRSKKVVVHI